MGITLNDTFFIHTIVLALVLADLRQICTEQNLPKYIIKTNMLF